MAKWKVVVECENCGRDVVRQGTGYNRQDADNQEAWAVEHPGLCPECWHKLQDEKRAAMWKGFPFCALEGVSEKQISYADTVRKNWAENQVRHRPWEWGLFFKYYGQWLEGLDPDSMEKVLKDLTPEKLEALRRQDGVPRAVLERLEMFPPGALRAVSQESAGPLCLMERFTAGPPYMIIEMMPGRVAWRFCRIDREGRRR